MHLSVMIFLILFGQPNENETKNKPTRTKNQERYEATSTEQRKKDTEIARRQLEQFKEDLKTANRQLSDQRRGKGSPIGVDPKEAKREAMKKVQELGARLRTLRNKRIPVEPRISFRNLSLGQIGRIQATGITEVIQVQGPEKLLVENYYHDSRPRRFDGNLTQPAGPRVTIATVIVKGVPAKGITSGQRISLDQVFDVTGTESYRTAGGGTNTVFVLQPFEFDWDRTQPGESKPNKKRQRSSDESKEEPARPRKPSEKDE